MAAQTVSVNRNLDESAIAGLANGEDITVNTGARLTINSDNRWSQQAAIIGSIAIDSATGGSVLIDGRDVWWIPFDGGTGNVPALGTWNVNDCTGSVAGAGEFLGIFTALGVAPTAAAAAMPATGFLKMRRKTADFADNEVITLTGGATVTVNSSTGGQRGWLHLVLEEGSTGTVPRLGSFEARGDWFYLADTNGADDQTIQYPVADVCPAIQVETSAGSGVYEWWLCAGSRWGQAANRVATDARGKYFGCTASGVITIARRATNSCGLKPATGCKVRVPNVHVSNAVTTTWVTPSNSATLGTRWDFTTSSAGALTFDKVAGNWYMIFAQAYSVSITDCATTDQINISECATKPVLTRAAVGLVAANDQNPLNIASCFAGVDLIGCRVVKYENESGDLGALVTDCDAVTITGGRYETFGDNTAATLTRGATGTAALTLTRVTNSTLEDVVIIGGLRLTTCVDVDVIDLVYGDKIEGATTNTTNGIYAVDINTGSSRCLVSGYGGNADGIANIHPYAGLVNIAASYACEVRNIGTPAAPYDCGSANAVGCLVNMGGNGADHIVQRCYGSNVRTGAIVDANSDSRCSYIDVWGDGADTGLVLNGLNLTARNLRSTNPTTGATAVYGTHFYTTFISTTEARLVLLGNEPTALSGSKCQVTGGTARFTSTGQCKLVAANDEVTLEMDKPWLGITALNNAAPTFSGTNAANHTIEFQYAMVAGAWNGTWLAATGANLSGIGAIAPATGIWFKWRVRCNTASATNAFINIRITATTNATDYQTQEPLPGVQLTVAANVSLVGAEVRVYDMDNAPAGSYGTELSGVESCATATYTFDAAPDNVVWVQIMKAGYVEFGQQVTAFQGTLPVVLQAETNA
jgi:hypothetical protein